MVGAGAVHEAGLAKGPAEHRAKESGRAEIEPALQEKAAALIGDDGRFVRGVVDGAVGFCGGRIGRGREGAGAFDGNDDAR